MMSMQKSNIPFYVLETQKCVKLRKIRPSRGVVEFAGFMGEDLTRLGGGKISGGIETPVGAKLQASGP